MRPFPLMFAAFALALGLAAPAEAFRCGNRIVTEGDDIGRVLHICGEPITVRQWTDVRVRPIYYRERLGPFFERRHRSRYAVPVEVLIEEWTYNLGARRFMRVLRFENGRLVDIRTTNYGYPD